MRQHQQPPQHAAEQLLHGRSAENGVMHERAAHSDGNRLRGLRNDVSHELSGGSEGNTSEGVSARTSS